MSIARAMCGLTHVTVAALCSSCSLLCISNSDWATENEVGRPVSVNGNEEPGWRDLSSIQFSCNCKYSLITHNKTPVHSTWGLLSVCLWPARFPVLTWVPSYVHPGNNIQDTFLIGSATVTTDRPIGYSTAGVLRLSEFGSCQEMVVTSKPQSYTKSAATLSSPLGGTELQAGESQVRFPIVSLELFIILVWLSLKILLMPIILEQIG